MKEYAPWAALAEFGDDDDLVTMVSPGDLKGVARVEALL